MKKKKRRRALFLLQMTKKSRLAKFFLYTNIYKNYFDLTKVTLHNKAKTNEIKLQKNHIKVSRINNESL